MTRNNLITTSFTFDMPNATTTRMQYDRRSTSRKLQIFYNKTCQFLHARVVSLIIFIGTVFSS